MPNWQLYVDNPFKTLRDTYSRTRDDFAAQLLGVGGHGAHPGDPNGTSIHVRSNEGLLDYLPTMAWPSVIPALQLAGVGNEVVGGVTEMAQGRPFFSSDGFDTTDLAANQVGIGNAFINRLNPKYAQLEALKR